ncbi:MAG: radical SAM protein [Deltaproteobacteria bacterium]|nr:radical SAM protein [Deltaproteobacteria bacterium]
MSSVNSMRAGYSSREGLSAMLLLYPPFADPTQPYVSLPTLKGYLRRRRRDVRVVDLNIEAYHYLLSDAVRTDLKCRVEDRFAELDSRRRLSCLDQMAYWELYNAFDAVRGVESMKAKPQDILRNGKDFYDSILYRKARNCLESLFQLLSAAYHPFSYGMNRVVRGMLPWSFDMLDEYWQAKQNPFDGLYRSCLTGSISLGAFDIIGISLTFPSQIPDTFYLCRLLRELAPRAFIIIGGALVHQTATFLDEKGRGRLLSFCDAFCTAEGEETLEALSSIVPHWRDRSSEEKNSLLAEVPNLAFGRPVRTGPERVFDAALSESPDYGDLDMDLYLSPSPSILYAPSRGCYWNKCSFCYYGLNRACGRGYREIPTDRAAAQVGELAAMHNAKTFYLSCDVLAPGYALDFARALLKAGADISWSTDLKVEKYYGPEQCALLRRSGLRAAAFGIESGSDRVLGLMKKGADIATNRCVSRNFHEAGVAVQWMMFTGHPGETGEEALASAKFVEREYNFVDLFIIGEFGLTPGSLIANEPNRFGIQEVYFAAGDDLRLYPLYSGGDQPLSKRQQIMIDRRISRLSRRYLLDHYPWAGAISTNHSMLYFIAFGQRAFIPAECGSSIMSRRRDSLHRPKASFSIERIEENIDRAANLYLRKALQPEGPGGRAPFSLDHFVAHCAGMPSVGAGGLMKARQSRRRGS